MDIQEVLQWTDEQVFTKTGKHLDSLQKTILEGTWQGQKYPEIAKNNKRSHDHIKQAARELWKLLSDVLEVEDIKQSNVISILKNKAFSSIYNFGEVQVVSSNINSPITICREKRQYAEEARQRSPFPPDSPQNKAHTRLIDLTDAPDIPYYHNRTSELTTLKQWILEAHTRLITIYGLSEIGKSAIALQLIQQTQTEFDYIIWRSLSNTPTLSTLQTELKQVFS